MKSNLQLVLLFAPLLVAGCYTQFRPPAEFGVEDTRSDYWADPYYAYYDDYYPAPWEVYPGSRWWYADYWPGYYSSHPYEQVDDSGDRHGWDRGPGSYVPSVGGHHSGGVIGGGGGGGGRGAAVPAPAPTPTDTTPTTPPDPPKVRDTSKPETPPTDKRPEKSEPRKGWGR